MKQAVSGLVLSFAASASGALLLAFGVDTDEFSATTNQVLVFDLHNDHYHGYSWNNGTNPSGHVPMPFEATPGGPVASLTLASMDISPFNSSYGRFTTTGLALANDFHLVLQSVTDENDVAVTGLQVAFWHGDHTHGMSAGSEEHLDLSETQQIDFSFANGAAQGAYYANFIITDEEGNYLDSSPFRIQVNAVPEPGTALLLSGVTFLLWGRRKR
ncbi:MAG: PEP-CTERM sorting domain-containing protein [Verrucomicrobiales bacterium]